MLKNIWHYVTDTPHDNVQYYRDLLVQGNSSLQLKKIADAQKAYQKIIKDILRIKQPSGEFLNILSNAYLGMGSTYQTERKVQEAVNAFLAARINGFLLPQEVLRFVATDFVQRTQLTPEAIRIYRAYIANCDEKNEINDPVINFLKSYFKTCFEPNATADQVRGVINLAKDLLQAKPSLEWALFPLGYSQGRMGNYQEGIRTLQMAEKINLNRAATPFYIGYFFSSLKDYPNAYNAYKRSLIKDPKQPEALFLLSRSILDAKPKIKEIKSELLDEAKEYLQQATNQSPKRADIWFYLGMLERNLGHKNEAKDAFAQSVNLENNNYNYQLAYGNLLHELGETDKALIAYQTAYKIDQNKYEVNISLASLFYQTGKFTDSQTYFQRSNQIKPNQEEVWIGLGSCFFQQQLWTEAIKLLVNVKAHTTDSAFKLARAFSLSQNYDSAVSIYEQYLQQFGENSLVQYYLGLALAHLGKFNDAINAFEQIGFEGLSSDISVLDIFIAKSHAFLELKMPAKIVELQQSLPTEGQHDPRVVYMLATAHIRMNQWTEAKAIINQAKDLLNNDFRLSFMLALIFEHNQQWNEAAQAYSRYLNLAGQFADAPLGNTRRGACLVRAGDFGGAVSILSYFTSYSSETRFWMAMALSRLGKLSEAQQWWDKLCLEFPQSDGIHNALIWTLFELGRQSLEKNNYKEAIIFWKKCGDHAPISQEVKDCLEESYFRQALVIFQNRSEENISELRSNLESAYDIDPNDLRVLFYIGLEALLCHDGVRALFYFEQISHEQWGNALPIYYQAVACLQANRITEAKKLMELLESQKNNLWDEYHLLATNIAALEHDWEGMQEHIKASLVDMAPIA
jgi:tetratricopeptide (TPR) repeat protein